MTRALIFDFFGVLIDVYNERRDPAMFTFVTSMRQSYKVALLSNMSADGLLRRLPVEDQEKYFDITVASAGVGMAKPDIEIYEYVAAQLGVKPEECIMIDDTEAHCEGARRAGMQAIHFESFEQLQEAIRPHLH